ncbi:DIP13, partial [Symbiodinium sp. KB8]
ENIEELRGEREDVNRRLLRLDEERARLQKEIQLMTSRLSEVNHEMSVLSATRSEYDQTIRETEGAYMKILESAKTLCDVVRRESVTLTKKFHIDEEEDSAQPMLEYPPSSGYQHPGYYH